MGNLPTRKWSKAEIRNKLETDNKWLIRGLLAIYARQTEDERNAAVTKHDNGVGFNGVDSSFLSNMAQFYKINGFLTTNQMKATRKAMLKYAEQLTKISNKVI